jgi:hypothetical protein
MPGVEACRWKAGAWRFLNGARMAYHAIEETNSLGNGDNGKDGGVITKIPRGRAGREY